MPQHDQESFADTLRAAIRLYFNNDRVGCSNLLDSQRYLKENGHNFGKENPNAASVLKSVHALLTVVEGLLSGSSDTIGRCLDEFWAAEKLANECNDKEWMGNRISRGTCYLFGGLLQVFIRSYVKAGVNLTIGYKLIHDFERDLLNYKGPDCEIIRSFGLLVLAILNFFSLILPPSVATLGDMLGLKISRTKFSEYIHLCMSENGDFSNIARLVYVYYLINSKSFMFNKIDPEELRHCREIIDAAMHQYPNSVVIRVMNASVCLGEGNPAKAVLTLSDSSLMNVIENRAEWSTMALAVFFKLGVSNLCMLDFEAAKIAFSNAANAIDKTKKWNYIPFMRTLEGMSYLAAVSSVVPVNSSSSSSSAPRSVAQSIFAPTYIDHDLSGNPIILPGDLWGSRMGYEYACFLQKCSDDEFSKYLNSIEPLVDILYGMVTCLYCFDKLDTTRVSSEMIERIRGLKSKRANLVLGEYYRKMGQYDDSVAFFDDAIEMADDDIRQGNGDKDSILPFSLVFQGAALCMMNNKIDTAKEVLSDLDDVIARGVPRKVNQNRNTFFGLSLGHTNDEDNTPKPGNIVNVNGGEFELMLNFRRNALKQKIDSFTT